MPDYIFKTYIDSGREYYEYTDAADREQTIKKDFPFPESLMELLYMDTQELEAITKKMDKALLAFYQSGAKDDLQVVAAGLDELASRHVYFELLRLDWTERLNAAERVTPKEYLRLLPHLQQHRYHAATDHQFDRTRAGHGRREEIRIRKDGSLLQCRGQRHVVHFPVPATACQL